MASSAPGGSPATPPPPRPPSPARVTVRRTGGFIGRTVEATLDLTGDDPRVAEARALLAGLDPAALPAGRPHPDMYAYTLDVDGTLSPSVPEHLLPADLRRLVELVLAG